MDILQLVEQTIEQDQLLPEEGTIVVAVSGGADSLCLLHMLHRLCGPGKHYPGVQLHIAHMNHQLRGVDSERDAEVVEQIAHEMKLPFTLGSEDVKSVAKREQRSLEEAARIVRYRFLRATAKGNLIAVAHQRDDQVETLLLHWIRGGGLASMIGLQPKQQDIIRPLLSLSRSDTHNYCSQYGLMPQEDVSNQDMRFVRNRIRHELLPLLKEINPGFNETLLRNATIMRTDYAWLESEVARLEPAFIREETEDTISLDRAGLLAQPLSMRRHILRRASARLCGGQSPLELRHYSILDEAMSSPTKNTSRSLDLPQQLRAIWRDDILWLKRVADDSHQHYPNMIAAEVALTLPGQIKIPGTSWLARAEFIPDEMQQAVDGALQRSDWQTVWQLLPVTENAVYVDADTLKSAAGEVHICIRTRRDGDRMMPLGMSSEKKIQDILVDQHIPQELRSQIPIFFSSDHCIWLAGIRLDMRVRLTNATRQIARLSIIQIKQE